MGVHFPQSVRKRVLNLSRPSVSWLQPLALIEGHLGLNLRVILDMTKAWIEDNLDIYKV